MKEKLEHMEKVVKDLDAFSLLMIEKITEEKEEKAILLQTVQKLEATLASERKQQEQDITERSQSWTRKQKQLEERVAQLEVTLDQTTLELQSSLKIHEELEKTVDCERESWTREQKKVEEHVAQLDVTLKQMTKELQSSLEIHKELEKTIECERKSWTREQKRLDEHVAQLEATLVQTTMELQDTQNHCEKVKNSAEQERDHLIREKKRLEERVAQFERKQEDEREKTKLDIEERNNLQLQTNRGLQDTQNLCEEEKKTSENKTDHYMRVRERWEEIVAQLRQENIQKKTRNRKKRRRQEKQKV
ncbi:hypothetical protein C0J50_9765 [Silurus asotus]|uniref:Uncharacterized protein n=1 Tax=Silurus asotus TaxID=30991 RepID=A0AAD5A154_SILAS|nr:hypothetical protein C0J50_9765 [Silurus asotus]